MHSTTLHIKLVNNTYLNTVRVALEDYAKVRSVLTIYDEYDLQSGTMRDFQGFLVEIEGTFRETQETTAAIVYDLADKIYLPTVNKVQKSSLIAMADFIKDIRISIANWIYPKEKKNE